MAFRSHFSISRHHMKHYFVHNVLLYWNKYLFIPTLYGNLKFHYSIYTIPNTAGSESFTESHPILRKDKFTTNINLWQFSVLRVRAFFHKTVRVCHVYYNFKIGFTCWITVIFGKLRDGSLLINTLASNICFSYRNMFQNGVDALSNIVDAFLSKSSKFHLVRITR